MSRLNPKLFLLLSARGFLFLLAIHFHIHLFERVKQRVSIFPDPCRLLQNAGSSLHQFLGGVPQVHLRHST